MKQTDGSGLVRGGEESPKRSVTVRVPATSANIGPGYDCLGMAVSKLYVSFFFLFFHPLSIGLSFSGLLLLAASPLSIYAHNKKHLHGGEQIK